MLILTGKLHVDISELHLRDVPLKCVKIIVQGVY